MSIESKAHAAMQQMQSAYDVPQMYAFDPAIFAAIAAAIVQVIQAISQCTKTPAAAVKIVKSPGILRRLNLRMTVKQQLKEHAEGSPRGPKLWSLVSETMGALLDVGADTTADEWPGLKADADRMLSEGALLNPQPDTASKEAG